MTATDKKTCFKKFKAQKKRKSFPTVNQTYVFGMQMKHQKK